MVLVSSDLTIELPYYVEEEYSSEELESWDLHEPYDPEREYNTEDRRTSNSPEYCLLAIGSLEFFCGHTDEDSIVSAHHEIDHDDIQQSK